MSKQQGKIIFPLCKCAIEKPRKRKDLSQVFFFRGFSFVKRKSSKVKNMVWTEVQRDVWTYENPGDSTEGILKEVFAGDFGDNFVLESAEGRQILVWGTKVLQNRIKVATIKVGEKIRITYLGEDPPKQRGYKPTQLFKVEVDR